MWQADSIVWILVAKFGANLVHQAFSQISLQLFLDFFADLVEIGGLGGDSRSALYSEERSNQLTVKEILKFSRTILRTSFLTTVAASSAATAVASLSCQRSDLIVQQEKVQWPTRSG